jgi:DNA polymerase-3 subunit epsilon
MSDTARQIVVVDVETTGLDPQTHTLVEVAWWNLTTGQRGEFVPPHSVSEALQHADVKALQVNRYIDRLAEAGQDADNGGLHRLGNNLSGNTFAGSNPAFDAAFLAGRMERIKVRWHHRLLDLSAYAAGVLHLPATELPGLSTVCELLGVENTAPHTAAGDVDATGRCFQILMEKASAA